jgi:hypothetical protein
MKCDVVVLYGTEPGRTRFQTDLSEGQAERRALKLSNELQVDTCVVEAGTNHVLATVKYHPPRTINFRPMHFDPLWHQKDCRYRVAALGAVAVECPHGFGACPTCDPCTCILAVDTVTEQ